MVGILWRKWSGELAILEDPDGFPLSWISQKLAGKAVVAWKWARIGVVEDWMHLERIFKKLTP
jgi:hypothetical protein